jgi:asparagine synthase (glutamine-hydrolysing)
MIVEARHTLQIEMSQLYGMRRCIEYRFPFMDWDLISFALAIPTSYWPPPWRGERLHRRPLRHLLPKPIVDRRSKAEFSPALANRVRRQLPAIRARFMSRSWNAGAYVDQRDARAALETFASSENPSFSETWAVWGIAAVEAWLEKLSRYTPAP